VQLANLMLFVPDLAEARRFYGETLGLPLLAETADYLRLTLSERELVVFRCERPGTVGDYADEARAVIVFAVPSVAEALARFRAQGVPCLHAVPAEGPLGRYAAFVDPFGIVHEVQEPLPVLHPKSEQSSA